MESNANHVSEGMISDVVSSVFTPGINAGVVKFVALVFVLLFLVLVSMEERV